MHLFFDDGAAAMRLIQRGLSLTLRVNFTGKEKALNSLVGAVMKKTKGRADARTAREILLAKTV